MCPAQGYEGERNTDPNTKKMAQAKLGLDRNANKKKKKKKVAVVEEGPSKDTQLFLMFSTLSLFMHLNNEHHLEQRQT